MQDVTANGSEDGAEGWNGIQGAFWRAGKIAADFKHAEVTPRFADEAVQIIRSHHEQRRDKPLFLYLALPSPHTPWLPSKEFVGMSNAGAYSDFVMQVDAVVGRVVEALAAADMSQDTLLIFSSDNGPVWYEKDVQRFGHKSTAGLRGMKFSPLEGGHRVPFMVQWPSKISAKSLSEQTIVFSDVLATFAELVCVEKMPKGVGEDSVSFLPHLLDPSRAATPRGPIVHDRRTIRDGDWKLILPAKGVGPGELYNLKSDLYEQNNRIEEHPEVAERLASSLRAIGA